MSALNHILSGLQAIDPSYQTYLDDLSARIVSDGRFAHLSPNLVPENIGVALNEQAQTGYYNAEQALERVHELTAEQHLQMEKVMPGMKKTSAAAIDAMPRSETGLQRAVSGQQRFWGGMALLGAALNTFFAYDSAKAMRKTNPQTGQQETQWSQVGITLLNASLALGLAYMGAQQLRGRM